MERFSSADLPAAERKTAYEAALRGYFGDEYADKNVRVDISQPESFTASVDPFTLGHIRGAMHRSNAPHSVFLAPADIKSGDLDFYLLLNGEIAFEGDKGPVHLRSGDMTIMRTDEPLSSISSQMDMIALCLPPRLLCHRLDDRPLAINQTVSGRTGLGACLGALLRAVAQRNDELSDEERLVLQSSVVEAILQAVSTDCEAPESSAAQQDAKLRLLKRSALSQIRDPELSPNRLADDTGVSVRTVHRLFHSSGATFRDWLREQRLDRCLGELMDPPKNRHTVADIAYRWGFNDLTTFNRSFKTKYGVSPTAARCVQLPK